MVRSFRKTSARGSQQVSARLLKKWVYDCEQRCGHVCNATLVRSAAITLVDVSRKCLVSATTKDRYIALSYVWGQLPFFQTTVSNFERLSKPRGLFSEAQKPPSVVLDAMQVVRLMGERYLWVDSLCIVQDDAASKHVQLSNMDLIYKNALATIVALWGDNANSPLPGIQAFSRPAQMIEKVGRFELLTVPMPLHHVTALSSWDSRCWTFQEKLLSRRCIYFWRDCVYFQCSRKILCEIGGSGEEVWDPSEPGVARNPFPELLRGHQSSLSPGLGCQLWDLEAYKHIVEPYTKRSLTFPMDIQNALSGLITFLEARFIGKMIFGLPAPVLDLVLLWTPAARIRRRQRAALETSHGEGGFPSWSWMGWLGPINHMITSHGENHPIPTPVIDLFTINVAGEVHTIHQRGDGGSTQGSVHVHPYLPMVQDLVPNTLYFQTEAIHADRFRFALDPFIWPHTPQHEQVPNKVPLGPIYDAADRRCGVWFLPTRELDALDGLSNAEAGDAAYSHRDLIVISKYPARCVERGGGGGGGGGAGGMYQHISGRKLEAFDREFYGVEEGEYLLNVMVVGVRRRFPWEISWEEEGEEEEEEEEEEYQLAQRVTVGQIHGAAWRSMQPRMTNVGLA